MSWTLLLGIVLVLGLALAAALLRQSELRRMQQSVKGRDDAVRTGAHRAKLQHPIIDLSRCLGCATCVAVCPEDDVLEIVHGQAVVVAGSRCMGVAACERECPVGAVTVTIADAEDRDDIPALDGLEAVGQPGLYLAGEVTAHALIRTAILHGTEVARDVAARKSSRQVSDGFDLCIVGAGPAGIACALEAKRLGLDARLIEQEDDVGGTVAKYPRRKLVLTEPVDLPLHGPMRRKTYVKEELTELWQSLVHDHDLQVETGRVFEGLERDASGVFLVRTSTHTYRAHNVCLALGRRGSPNKLGVPGEDLPHVAYGLIDAQSYAGRRVLVVGAGDSAVEAALAIAEQPNSQVTIACRGTGFPRVRSKNAVRLEAAVGSGRIEVRFGSIVTRITETEATIETATIETQSSRGHEASGFDGSRTAATSQHTLPRVMTLPVDDIFVFIGGVPPKALLESSGVSFDPSLRPQTTPIREQGTGIVTALWVTLGLAAATIGFALWHADYYGLSLQDRPPHPKHEWLRPGLGLGLGFGIAAMALIVLNLLYVLRRNPRMPIRFGSLRAWMSMHVVTGVLALFLTLLHAGMAPRDTSGGHAFWALVVLAVTGAIGRYLYAWVPRAANGREAILADMRSQLAENVGDATRSRGFVGRATARIEELVRARQWGSTFVSRVTALLGSRLDLNRALDDIRREAEEHRTTRVELLRTLAVARRAHREALGAAHLEDLRALMNTWRWIHRWVGALLVLLLVIHIVHSTAYGA
ncbi:MAG: NAD(P)-binding domain-containing protein [Planctomycetes bacterium]|nr:NAD(P)-binding domain-containing protein [Planctomycetota bacterium]